MRRPRAGRIGAGAAGADVVELAVACDEAWTADCERLVEACMASEDYIEGRQAFMEKRTPEFSGR